MSAASDAAQRAAIATSVEAGIANVNQIIDILGHPASAKGDLIEMDYPPEAVKSFEKEADACEQNFTAASTTASAWFMSIGNQLQLVTSQIGQVTAQINMTEQQLVQNHQLIAANVQAIAELTTHLQDEQNQLNEAQRQLGDAQRELDDARAEQDRVRTARLALCWMPIVAIALTVVDITKEQNDVASANSKVGAETEQVAYDQQLLQSHAQALEGLKQEGLRLNDAVSGLHASEAQLQAEQTAFTAQSAYLQPLKVDIDHCIHTVSGALGSAANIDNMMSMQNVGTAIKGLVAALQTDSSKAFSGALQNMNDAGFAELDKQIKAMQVSSKKLANLRV